MPIIERRDEEEFELLDLTDGGWLKRTFGDLTKASVAKQIAVGSTTGWCAGYMFAKVGRTAAAGVGCSLLILQIASHKGIIQINWGKLEKSVNSAKKTVRKDMQKIGPAIVEEVVEFVRENMFLAGGFAGGFLLGLAC